jgi:hypothetical protein
MTDAKSAWSTTGEQVSALGSKLGGHFEKKQAEEKERAGEQGGDDALKRIGGVVQGAVGAVGAAAKDEGVREDLKKVGRSLFGALDATFREASTEVRKAFASPDKKDTP